MVNPTSKQNANCDNAQRVASTHKTKEKYIVETGKRAIVGGFVIRHIISLSFELLSGEFIFTREQSKNKNYPNGNMRQGEYTDEMLCHVIYLSLVYWVHCITHTHTSIERNKNR